MRALEPCEQGRAQFTNPHGFGHQLDAIVIQRSISHYSLVHYLLLSLKRAAPSVVPSAPRARSEACLHCVGLTMSVAQGRGPLIVLAALALRPRTSGRPTGRHHSTASIKTPAKSHTELVFSTRHWFGGPCLCPRPRAPCRPVDPLRNEEPESSWGSASVLQGHLPDPGMQGIQNSKTPANCSKA